MIVLVLSGCMSSDLTPARRFAKKERVDISECDVTVLSTNVSVTSVASASVATTTTVSVVPISTERYLWTSSAESRVYVNRIREIDDNPLGVSVAIMAHAHNLMVQAENQLDRNEMPPAWMFDSVQPLLIEAHGYVEQLGENSYERQYALECKDVVWNRHLIALTKFNEAKAAAR